MKSTLSLIFIILNTVVVSQTKLKLDNNLTGIVSNSKTNSFGLNFTSNNGVEIGKFGLNLTTSYSNRFNTKLYENELINRTNVEYDNIKWNLFISHQFSYSLLRKINSDNLVGAGFGFKINNIDYSKISISYAIMYQNINNLITEDKYYWRHSIRTKFKFEREAFNLSFEYFYQPNITNFQDFIILGQTKLSLFSNKPFSLIIQDVLNYRSISDVKMVHNLTIGAGYKKTKEIKNPTKK